LNKGEIEHAMTGKPLDPEIARRVRERAEKATEEFRQKDGTLDVAVDIVRADRDEE
jgi:adenosyl cobinamide kinase/adenosyl cobinamide phosphate guanylyltransferase